MKTSSIKKTIPAGWKTDFLHNYGVKVIDGDRGKNYPSHDEFSTDGYCLFLNATNVSKQGFIFKDNQFISKEKDSSLGKGKLLRGDLVITTRGTIGNFAYYSDNIPYEHIRINSGMAVIRNITELTNLKTEYLLNYFKSSLFTKEIKRVSFGSAQPQLTIQIINKFKLNIPKDQNEQNRIVAVMETWDRAVEKLEKKIEIKKKIKKGLMQELSRGRLQSENYKQLELAKIGKLISGGTPSKKVEEYWQGTIPWISSSDVLEDSISNVHIHRFITNEGINDSATNIIPQHSIVMVSRVGVGKLIVNNIALCTSQDFQSLVINESQYNPYYLAYVIKEELKKLLLHNQGTSIKGILKNDLEALVLKVPEKAEQDKIAHIVLAADNEIEKLQTKLSLLKAQRKYLLNNLVTGAIRTPEKLKIN